MSDTVRVYEIAEEAGASSADVIAKAKDLNIDLKSPQSAVSYEDAEAITNYIMTGKSPKLEVKPVAKPKKVVEKTTENKTEDMENKTTEVKEVIVSETKVETIEKKDTEVRKKPELKKVVISKPNIKPAPSKPQEELDKPDVNPDNVNKIVPKRRGLVIIKKKKPKVEAPVEKTFESEVQPKKQMKSLSEILGGNEEDTVTENLKNNFDDMKKSRPKKEK